jgi:predicted nucleic acid-binding protein
VIAVDTSVLINLFRGRSNPAVERLRTLSREDVPFAIPDLCCMEILQGARDEREWQTLLQYLESQEVLSARHPLRTHIDAARIYFDCRRAGVTVRGPVDCLVAALVLEHDAILLHDDRDYEAIATVRPLRMICV